MGSIPLFSIIRCFSLFLFLPPPPLACSASGAESNFARGAEKFAPSAVIQPHLDFFLPTLIFFSALAKINPGHATDIASALSAKASDVTESIRVNFRTEISVYFHSFLS